MADFLFTVAVATVHLPDWWVGTQLALTAVVLGGAAWVVFRYDPQPTGGAQ